MDEKLTTTWNFGDSLFILNLLNDLWRVTDDSINFILPDEKLYLISKILERENVEAHIKSVYHQETGQHIGDAIDCSGELWSAFGSKSLKAFLIQHGYSPSDAVFYKNKTTEKTTRPENWDPIPFWNTLKRQQYEMKNLCLISYYCEKNKETSEFLQLIPSMISKENWKKTIKNVGIHIDESLLSDAYYIEDIQHIKSDEQITKNMEKFNHFVKNYKKILFSINNNDEFIEEVLKIQNFNLCIEYISDATKLLKDLFKNTNKKSSTFVVELSESINKDYSSIKVNLGTTELEKKFIEFFSIKHFLKTFLIPIEETYKQEVIIPYLKMQNFINMNESFQMNTKLESEPIQRLEYQWKIKEQLKKLETELELKKNIQPNYKKNITQRF